MRINLSGINKNHRHFTTFFINFESNNLKPRSF